MNLPGAYRKLVAFPRNLSWKCVGDEHGRTVDTSADRCTEREGSSSEDDNAKRPRLASSDCYEHRTEQLKPTKLNEVCRRPDNCCTNLEISFCLESSCYATSCIRELMKN